MEEKHPRILVEKSLTSNDGFRQPGTGISFYGYSCEHVLCGSLAYTIALQEQAMGASWRPQLLS